MKDLKVKEQKRIEMLLKRDMARRLESMQESRAFNADGGNIGNVEDYITDARALRKLLLDQRRQRYKPLWDFIRSGEWVDVDRSGIGRTDTVAETLKKIDEAGYVPREKRKTFTDFEQIPGN